MKAEKKNPYKSKIKLDLHKIKKPSAYSQGTYFKDNSGNVYKEGNADIYDNPKNIHEGNKIYHFASKKDGEPSYSMSSEKYKININSAFKSKSASSVLQLMDKDFTYQQALKKVMKSDNISKLKLEKEVNPFI